MGLFDKIREGLKKTRDSVRDKVERVVNSFTKIDEEFLIITKINKEIILIRFHLE